MSGTPLVTVLMCVHNGEDYLKEAMDSVLGQTHARLRFLIVDDASTDGSAGIMAGYGDPRVAVLRNEARQGLTRSLNVGLRSAEGEYVARMDADDICHPERLARQVAFMEANPRLAACGTWARLVDGGGRDIGRMKTPCGGEMAYRFWRPPAIIHPTACFRAGAIRRLGYDESVTYGQDYDLFLRLHRLHRLDSEEAMDNLPEYLLRYRLHGKAITSGRREEQLRSSYRIFKSHFRAEGVSYEEYASFLFAFTASPGQRWAGLRKLSREVPLPLRYRLLDNAKYALKWARFRLSERIPTGAG